MFMVLTRFLSGTDTADFPQDGKLCPPSLTLVLNLGVCAGLQNLVRPVPCLILDHPRKESLRSNQRTLGDRARLELASADFRRAPIALPAL